MLRHCMLYSRAFCTVKSPPLDLTKEVITKLERLSALQMQLPQESRNLAEDIQVAERIFEVNTEGVDPLHNIVDDFINCPVREDVSEHTSINETLANARKTFEGFFVSPSVGVEYKRRGKDGNKKTDR